MNPDFFRRVQELFAQAAELEPLQRAAFLDDACGDDADGRVRAEVESLLANLGRADQAQFLDRPAAETFALDAADEDDDLIGQVLGPYTVEGRVGGGGFGSVYRAVRSDGQYRRTVALKVLHPDLGGSAVLRRLRRERQALAGLEGHPHIVALFDAGLAPDGRPYFVMEYVEGQPLDAYCDGLRLPVRERLGLFLQACAAVQHAHKNLVVHRDLKPANILAGPDPAGGHTVKLLDFGIAKFLGPDPAEEGEEGEGLTRPGERVFTPAYASPEQVRGGRIDVTSDVYSLGVVLYELLSGHRPYRFEGAEAEAVVCGQEPESPSTKVGRTQTVVGAGGETVDVTPEAVSARRSAKPWQLRRELAGDLDNIVLKAMAKEPGRRYQSVEELARDVRAYLEGNPVAARGRPLGYRLGKLMRKHKGKLAVAAAGILLLAGVGGGGVWYAEQRSALRQEASRELEAAEAALRGGHWTEAREAFGRAGGMLGRGGPSDLRRRLAEAEELLTWADELDRIRQDRWAIVDGKLARSAAAPRYAASFAARGLAVGEADSDELAARVGASVIQGPLLDALDDWWGLDRRGGGAVLEVLRRIDPDGFRAQAREGAAREDTAALRTLADEADVEALPPASLVVLSEALPRENAVRLLRQVVESHPADFWAHFLLANHLGLHGRKGPEELAEAVGHYRAALALRPNSFLAVNNLGSLLRGQQNLAGAERALRQAVRLEPNYATAHFNLGIVLRARKDLVGAEREYREAIRIDPNDTEAHYNLGNVLYERKDLEGAEQAYREAIRSDPNYAPAHNNLGLLLRDRKDLTGAEGAYREAIRSNPNAAGPHNNLGVLLKDRKDLAGAEQEWREAIRSDPNFADPHNNLGSLLLDKRDLKGAERELREAIRIDPNLAMPHTNLGHVLYERQDVAGAERELREAIRIDPNAASAHNNLGNVLHERKDLDGAEKQYRAAIRINPNYAEAYLNLGNVLLDQGRFRQALESFRRGHDLGASRPGWGPKSTQRVKQAERATELDGQLPAVLAGNAAPASPREAAEFAFLCQHPSKRLYAASARLFADAFAAEPKLADPTATPLRYHAASASFLASCGRDAAGPLPAKLRYSLRKQALEWFRADLASIAKRSAGGKLADRLAVRTALSYWQTEADSSGVRGIAVRTQLSEAEQAEWRNFWAEVAAVLQQAGATPPPPPLGKP